MKRSDRSNARARGAGEAWWAGKMRLIVIGAALAALLAAAGIVLFVLARNDIVVVQSPLLVREPATVTYVSGDAEYRTTDSDGWRELSASTKLGEGDAVRTGSNGIVDIRLGGGTVLRVDENTDFTLDQNTLESIVVSSTRGTVFARLRRVLRRQRIELRSPAAVLSVRGTDVVFSVDEDATVAHVLSGIAEVYNPAFPDRRVLVGADNRTTVPRNGPPGDPKRARRETIREYREIIESIHERIVVEISYAIHFAPNTAEILPRSRSELERVRQRVQQTRGDIIIVGHTARVGDRSAMYELSVERAEAVRTYLVNNGIRPSRLSVVGYGAERPVATNETREGRARNRRVEFVIRW